MSVPQFIQLLAKMREIISLMHVLILKNFNKDERKEDEFYAQGKDFLDIVHLHSVNTIFVRHLKSTDRMRVYPLQAFAAISPLPLLLPLPLPDSELWSATFIPSA